MHVRYGGLVLALALASTGCDQNTSPNVETRPDAPNMVIKATGPAMLQAVNQRLAARGLKVRVHSASYVTSASSHKAGQTLFAFDRGNKHIGQDYAPNDLRRHPGTNITYLVDQSDADPSLPPSPSVTQVDAAIDRAMTTWETTTRCSKFAIDEVADPGVDPDVVDAIIFNDPARFGTLGLADVIHAGWESKAFFDAIAPNGSQFILAVTFPFVFVDENGNATDINGDHQQDTWFNEIYYNDAFAWGINVSTSPWDIETVALHESGHALSQNHFGQILITNANGKLHFSPFAVMNAAISRQAHSLTGTDIGGHCSLWGSWPQR
jgi:hypothetical protein